MGQEQAADYYDAMYANPDGLYALPVEEQPWAVLWREIGKRVGATDFIFDAGCGEAQLVQFLPGTVSYQGCDFSRVAIRNANNKYPYLFIALRDIAKYGIPSGIKDGPSFDTYIFSEVLEHITDDLAVLASVSSRRRVILTVPKNDDPSHVRTFQTKEDAVARYGALIDITDAITINKKWHLIEGVRR